MIHDAFFRTEGAAFFKAEAVLDSMYSLRHNLLLACPLL